MKIELDKFIISIQNAQLNSRKIESKSIRAGILLGIGDVVIQYLDLLLDDLAGDIITVEEHKSIHNKLVSLIRYE